MNAKSTAQRAFTLLIAGLLLSSVVAPAFFTGTASAQTAEGEDCSWDSPLIQLVGDTCTWDGGWDTVNDSADRDAAYVQSDHHAEMVGEYETAKQYRTIFDNYATDTGTIASLEARNAIATAYENNETATTADAQAQQAIQDYYSKKEINTLEAYSKQQAQLAYTVNSTRNHPDTLDRFVYAQLALANNGQITSEYYTGDLETLNYTLSNGTVYQYESAVLHVEASEDTYSGTYEQGVPITGFQDGSDYEIFYGNTYQVNYNGLANVKSSYAGTSLDISNGEPSQVVVDHKSWEETLSKWGEQSDTIEANYASGTASDLYGAMDNGSLDPADVRGAEGQVRYLSGDSNATDERYKAALYGTLNMEQAGFNSTFYTEYTGYTNVNYNRTIDGNRTVEYSGYVENQSLEGMVFSSEVPEGGFQPGNTYNTSNLNGTTMIYSQNSGTVTFVKGNLTIQKITDQNGTEQDSVSWQKPEYDTNNVSDYIDYLDRVEEMQLQLLEAYADDTTSGAGGGGWNIPVGSDAMLAGLAVIAAIALFGRD